MKSPVIDRADLQTIQQRAVSGALTVFFWAIWAYLWLPLLALVAWAFGLEQAYKYMVVQGGWAQVLRLIGIYTLVILLMGGSLYAWAAYNILRYGGLEPRTTRPAASEQEVARYFLQGPLAVDRWQRAQRLYVVHDEKGEIGRVEILEPGASVPHEAEEAKQG